MKKNIQIYGTYKLRNKIDSFTGTVIFEERENSIYYSWTLYDKEKNSIGGKSLNVAHQQIPIGQDKFQFSQSHAIQGIKKYRIGREKIIQELNVG